MQALCILFFLFNSITAQTQAIEYDAGKHFILTAPKYTEINDYFDWLEKTKPAGIMLVEFHMQDRQKTKQLCAALQKKARELNIYPLLICVDFEGGIVSRGADVNGFFAVPSPYKLAECGKHECFLGGKLIGQQLNDVEIITNFAPSVDHFDKNNYILATRCFSSDSKIVAQSAKSFIQGLLTAGVLPVIKHFPGLDAGKFDTHTTSDVKINLTPQEFEKNISPFKRVLKQNMPIAVMVGHAQYQQFGEEPASTSAAAISWIKNINQQALIITDDVAMQAYHKAESGMDKMNCICNAAIKSINNGFDLLILSASDKEQIELINKLNQMTISSAADVRSKIKNVCSSLNKFKTGKLNEEKTATELAKKSLLQSNLAPILPDSKSLLISVDLAKIRPATSFDVIEKNKNSRCTLLASLFANNQYNFHEFIFNPMKKESLEKVKNLTYTSFFQECDNIILQTFFYGSGVWNQNQEDWLNLLKPYAQKIIILSLGHPLEKSLVPNAQVTELGSFHSPMIKAAFDQLKKKLY